MHTSPNVLQGPRGSLVKEFKHLAVDIYMKDKKTIKVEKWFGKKKQIAAVRTVKSHIQNMFKGLTYVRSGKCWPLKCGPGKCGIKCLTLICRVTCTR